jgi:hypothetical protein
VSDTARIASAFLREVELGLHMLLGTDSELHVALVNARGEYFLGLKSSGQPVFGPSRFAKTVPLSSVSAWEEKINDTLLPVWSDQ